MPITLKYRNAVYIGQTNFDDVCQPIYSKSEYGIDVITRKMRGAAPNLLSFLNSLQQGQPMTQLGTIDLGNVFGGFGRSSGLSSFALQTWTSDDDPVYPTVTLSYKGLLNGVLPKPIASNSESLQSTTITCAITTTDTVESGGKTLTLSGNATRSIQYIANQTEWKYVSNQRVDGGTQTEITGRSPIVLYSVIRDENASDADGNKFPLVFTGQNAPGIYVVALTPAEIIQQTAFECQIVPGTPYFEISESQTRMYASNS